MCECVCFNYCHSVVITSLQPLSVSSDAFINYGAGVQASRSSMSASRDLSREGEDDEAEDMGDEEEEEEAGVRASVEEDGEREGGL